MQWASWLRDVYGLITAAGNPLAEDQVQPLLLALQQRYAASVGEPAVPDRRNLLLSYELHAFATRHPEVRAVLRSWREASRDSLARHFDPLTARALDALVEGQLRRPAAHRPRGGRRRRACRRRQAPVNRS
jgi:DNA-binding GntR family transcriptional regulator